MSRPSTPDASLARFSPSLASRLVAASSVAAAIGIPHYIVNFESRFDEQVVSNFISEYGKGRTPIPCSHCNSDVKFATLLDRALAALRPVFAGLPPSVLREDLLRTIADRLGELVGSDNVAIELVNEGLGGLAPVVARGVDAEYYLRPWAPGEAGLATWVLEHNEPVRIDDLPVNAGPPSSITPEIVPPVPQPETSPPPVPDDSSKAQAPTSRRPRVGSSRRT